MNREIHKKQVQKRHEKSLAVQTENRKKSAQIAYEFASTVRSSPRMRVSRFSFAHEKIESAKQVW